MADGFTVVELTDVPEVPDPEPDDPEWKPVRHYLRLSAFGANAFIAPDEGRRLVVDHTEEELGPEELYVVLSGRAEFTIDGESYDCSAGTLVAIPDPAVRRTAVSREAGTALLVIAGHPGRPYEISDWDNRWTKGLPQA